MRFSLHGQILRTHSVTLALLSVWLLVVGVGASVLLRYSYTPGRLASPPLTWPRGTTASKGSGRDTLVVFAHPQCPCSHATIRELAQILARSDGRLDAYVYFYAPESKEQSWVHSALWQEAVEIPGVHALEDPQGREGRKFGASVSGQTLFYDANGKLRFNGGITASRGHEGDNDGQDIVVSILQTGASARNTAPVFGCSLLGEI